MEIFKEIRNPFRFLYKSNAVILDVYYNSSFDVIHQNFYNNKKINELFFEKVSKVPFSKKSKQSKKIVKKDLQLKLFDYV